jgi:hypothetical protein
MPGMMKKTASNTERMVGYIKKTAAPKPKATPTTKPKTTPTPKPSPSTFAQKSKAAEAEFMRLMKAGKIKDIAKTRSMIAKKYGVSPNGFTN